MEWALRYVSDKASDSPAMRKAKAIYQLGRMADGKHMARIAEDKRGNKIIYKVYTGLILVPSG